MIEGLDLKEVPSRKGRGAKVKAFQQFVSDGGFDGVSSRRLVKASRSAALAKWDTKGTKEDNKEKQRREAAEKKKKARAAYRSHGVSTRGALLPTDKWRVLRVGDHDFAVWRKKLSFVPVVHIGKFGENNLAKLRQVQARLVEVIRLRGGGGGGGGGNSGGAKATGTHQKGLSLGITIAPGGTPPTNPREQSASYSGTIQLKVYKDPEMRALRKEVIAVLTACIEEAYGHVNWYKALKEAFQRVPKNRRLPGTTMPATGIWWNWNVGESKAHIDWNAVMPCFVFTPYTYKGAELLVADNNRKIPMIAGRIVGGSWQLFPHCNDKLYDVDRYSFVVYYDYRALSPSYWLR